MVKKKIFFKTGGVIFVLLLAGIILLFSIARASLNLTLKKERENILRKVPVKLLIKQKDGGIKTEVYLLPPVRTLPDNVFYNVKRMRDLLWIGFCQDKNEKINLAMLMADKKMAEAQILFVNRRADMAMKTADDGIELWKKARKMWQELDKKTEDNMVTGKKLEMARLAYKKILKRAEGAIDIDQVIYKEMISKLEKIDEKK